MARLLLAIAVPTHIFYLIIIRFWQKNFVFTAPFLISYMFAILIQVALLLYLAYGSVLWAWKRRINPDNSAIPFTSALADVFGNCLMAAVFTFLDAIGDVNAQVYETNDTTIASNLTANTINTFYL
jgi:solute carrier family 41